nr:PREDICTED: protein TASOR isoform X1 [Paralichthys olivaceus]
MDDSLARRPAARPRRLSAAAADSGANVSLQYGEVTEAIEVQPARETTVAADRPGAAAAGIVERRNSAPQVVHQRHMPMEPKKFHIPRKTKEKRALFRDVSTESREFEDMVNILTSSYFDTGSAGCFTYCKPRLVYSELLEKEFVEKRREMKMDGRTDTELEESYGFMLVDAPKVHQLCENGLCVSHSWITVLGNPSKGVYLSRYSDLLQINSFTPGATGEIIIFKVMKGKVKSIYENMKNVLDPTPRFDSHIFKNASKVTSLTSYRSFEFTQHYFYEYSFDELRQRPRQVCPYAVVSLLFKGKDTPLLRMNSQTTEGSKERAQFTVWTGDLVKGDQVLFQISLRSFSPPFLPHRLPEKLKIGCVMRLDQVTKLLPSSLFSYNLYNSSQEVVEDGHCCSLLEVIDRSRSTTNVTKLLQELEMKRVVLVSPLSERGFLFLLSSVQMASPPEREGNWKRCLQALFVFPESRDVAKSTSRRASSAHDASVSMSGATVMPHLSTFIPALHHALVKTRANPAPELSAGVERQAKEYLIGLKDGKVRQYPMGEYDSNQDEQEKHFPAPKHHKGNMDYYLRSYLHSPALYLLSVARARQVVEGHCGPEEPQQVRPRKSCAGQRESTGKEVTGSSREGHSNTKKLQQLVDLVLTCKRNAENEVKREEGGEGSLKGPGRKRRLEQQAAARALKFLKATQEPGRDSKIPVEGSQVSSSPDSLTSVIGSVGLRDVDLREDGSELAAKLLMLLTGLKQAAKGPVSQEEGQRESSPFDRLATKLGLPTNCDIDLRKQEELEEQTAGSVSSLEGFSPSSHSGEMNHRAGRGLGRGTVYGDDEEEEEIPWVLIPITGLSSDRYSQRERNIPKDPRFQHLSMTTSITTTTKPPGKSPALSPELSPPPSSLQCPSPRLSPPPFPTQCPSPDPSPPLSPSQCPSPEPSPSLSPSQCPSPELSPPTSPSQCPSLQPPLSPSQHTSPSPSLSRCHSPEPMQHIPLNKGDSGANEERLAPTASTEFKAGMSRDRREKPQETAKKNEEPSVFSAIQPTVPPAPERRTSPSPPLSAKEYAEGEMQEMVERDAVTLIEKVQKQREEKATECKRDGEEVVDVVGEVAGEKKQKGEVKEMVGGSLSSPSVSLPLTRPLRDIDSIVDKHLGNFSSEMQLLLQGESIHYSFPQSPHSTSNTETTAPQHTLPHSLSSQFSEYVSLYNSCPPVNDYVSSLKDGINSMLIKFGDIERSHNADTSRTNADNKLASSVSAFVASIRAANTKTGSDDEASAPSGELTAAHPSSSVSQTPALSRGGEVWQPDATRQFPDATSRRKSPTSNVTVSTPTSASVSVYKSTDPTHCHPPSDKLSQSHWKPQQSHTSEINRTGAQNIRLTQDRNFRITQCATDVEAGSSGTELNSNLTPPGSSGVSLSLLEPPLPTELVSTSASVSPFAPPTTALSSLINQLQPEVFSSLVKIIKDVKKKSLQFYLHSTEERDPLLEDIKRHLLKQGNMEKSPVAFLNHENPDNRLLVIIKNKDIAGHIHKIPNLVSLKRRPSVVFVGIDTLGDIRNNSYNELFVSGGCIVSDEMILNPDFISHGQLAELLLLLEQQSSLESVWKWKVHCKTHKKLKEQASFRREAANLLDLLSAYQKRQVVEFLPYHRCDMMNHQSPDLDCLIELQARYTQYRHTIFLTEHCHERLPAYASGGIIVAGIEEILQDFTRVVGYHDIKDKQPAKDVLLATKGLGLQLSHGDSVSGSERSPSIFPEHIHPLSSSEQPKHLMQQPSSGLFAHHHLSDQLVPDASLKDGVPRPSDTDFEVLRQAISQLRAERQAQLQQQQRQLDCQEELSVNPQESLLSNSVKRGSGHTTPPVSQGGHIESTQLTPGRKAVADTLDLIHSTLQPGEQRRQDRGEPPTEGQRRGISLGGEGVGLLGGNSAPTISDASNSSSNDNTATVTRPNDQTHPTSAEREQADQQGEPAFSKATKHGAAASSTFSCPVEDDRSRDAHSGQERPIRAEGALTRNSNDSEVTRTPNTALPQLQQIQLHQQQLQPTSLHPQPPAHIRQQQWSMGLLQPHILPQIHSQHFSAGPTLRPLSALGRAPSLLGPSPTWRGGLVWGFPQAPPRPALLGVYHNPAAQGNSRYRGGQRGGFNGM